ncbi:hypothetical protein Nepgr_012075 [Nepenthes gracilis]|uniref:C2 NT-type domain-containing protein n=1 Tax=Nepenthes gracilis TaxID=150966 RepID=A0AAD3SGH0_NEPGR|nr:hypothetical protein Nepgr_012075 [Nepenthes gracilis]
MVVNMINCRPRPSPQSRRFEATIMVHSLKGLQIVEDDKNNSLKLDGYARLMVEIRWKGSKSNGLRALRKREKRNYTKEERLREDGVVQWDEEFRTVCAFSGSKEGIFHPWEVAFIVFNSLNEQPKNRALVAGPAVLNLADYDPVTLDDEKELEINVPLTLSSTSAKCGLSLCLSLSLMKLRTALEPPEAVPRPIIQVVLSPCFRGAHTTENDSPSLKTSCIKVKSFIEIVLGRKSKKTYHWEVGGDGKFSTESEDLAYTYPFDSDSFYGSDEGDSEGNEDNDVQKSVRYGKLISANLARGAFSSRIHCEDEDQLCYSNHKLDVSCLNARESAVVEGEQSLRQSPKLGILTWSTRMLSFRSPKAKGEPLLKKEYGEEGGDDIDFDRRQLCSSDQSAITSSKLEEDSIASVCQFGDDNFAVGSWECKAIMSREGSMKLRTQVFFASIDQRNERAAGESACTALVAVIADWLHLNCGEIPIKSEFDSLIREGSLQWQKLCNNEAYRDRFPDKHFDLETVLQAKIRPLSIMPEKSFVGFFHPEGVREDSFNFLHGAMSFDSIWDEICLIASECPSNVNPLVYIVSWNDHFFVLKLDSDAFYIIDTLGERLYEGCKQAYALKFDRDTTIERMPQMKTTNSGDKLQPEKENAATTEAAEPDESVAAAEEAEEVEVVVCRGKESCKEYIKSFLAAIPIRGLQADIESGLMGSELTLHHRLQIEFHHTVLAAHTAEHGALKELAVRATVD